MIKKILTGLAALGAFFSAIFFMLFKVEKSEKKASKAEADYALDVAKRQEAARKAEEAVYKKKAEIERENEKLVEKVHSDNGIESFDAGIDLLRKQSERGKGRNSCSDNSRA